MVSHAEPRRRGAGAEIAKGMGWGGTTNEHEWTRMGGEWGGAYRPALLGGSHEWEGMGTGG